MAGGRWMVWRLAVAAVLALLLLVGCSAWTPQAPRTTTRAGGSSPLTSAAPVALPSAPAARTPAPLLAVISDQPTVLARLDPRSLRPLPGRRVDLGEPVAGYAFSPDRSMLVLGDNDQAALVVVDVAGMRLLGRVLLEPGGGAPSALAWLGPRRVAAVTQGAGGASLVLVDPLARRVLTRQRLGGVLAGAVRLPGRLVLLLTPDNAIGPARLAVVDGQGAVRAVTLRGIAAGFEPPAVEGPTAVGQQRVAGLAVDAAGGRAFVVAADAPVAEVDLASLRVADHAPRQPVGWLGRLAGWLAPPAQAKAVSGPARQACWLGGGLLAVAGFEARVRTDPGGQVQNEQVPAGGKLLDLRGGTVRPLDAHVSQVSYRSGWLLTFGGGWNGAEQRWHGAGLGVYGPGAGGHSTCSRLAWWPRCTSTATWPTSACRKAMGTARPPSWTCGPVACWRSRRGCRICCSARTTRPADSPGRGDDTAGDQGAHPPARLPAQDDHDLRAARQLQPPRRAPRR